MEFFDAALEDLQDNLPQWWAQHDPASELYKLLVALAPFSDELAEAAEGIFADQRLVTARDTERDDALRTEWALLFGASNEQLPTETELLREYLRLRAEDDGSRLALEAMLLALLRNPENDAGTTLTFDAGGAGLTFPADGSGLAMFELVPEGGFLTIPVDGSGVEIPADGSGVLIPDTARVEVIEDFADHTFTVNVREILFFDRALFARAVDRGRLASLLPPTIVEVP